jgi:hypothetical protein
MYGTLPHHTKVPISACRSDDATTNCHVHRILKYMGQTWHTRDGRLGEHKSPGGGGAPCFTALLHKLGDPDHSVNLWVGAQGQERTRDSKDLREDAEAVVAELMCCSQADGSGRCAADGHQAGIC